MPARGGRATPWPVRSLISRIGVDMLLRVAARAATGRLSVRNIKVLGLWRKALVESVRRDGPDLSARQLALLLTVYLVDPPHTVRGLAHTLNISKPAITRALDRLSVLGFIKRKRDTEDRRNVLVQRTVKGSVYLSEFADLVVDAGAVTPEDMVAHLDAERARQQTQSAVDKGLGDRTGAAPLAAGVVEEPLPAQSAA